MPPEPKMVSYFNPEVGEVIQVPTSDAEVLREGGYAVGDEEAKTAYQASGATGALEAAALGVVQGATFHLADLAMPDSAKPLIAELQRQHGFAHGAGEILGGGAVIGGAGALTGGLGGGLLAQAGARVAASAIGAGVETAVEASKTNNELTGERFLQSVGIGATLGVFGEGVGYAFQKTIPAAQRYVNRKLARAVEDGRYTPDGFTFKIPTKEERAVSKAAAGQIVDDLGGAEGIFKGPRDPINLGDYNMEPRAPSGMAPGKAVEDAHFDNFEGDNPFGPTPMRQGAPARGAEPPLPKSLSEFSSPGNLNEDVPLVALPKEDSKWTEPWNRSDEGTLFRNEKNARVLGELGEHGPGGRIPPVSELVDNAVDGIRSGPERHGIKYAPNAATDPLTYEFPSVAKPVDDGGINDFIHRFDVGDDAKKAASDPWEPKVKDKRSREPAITDQDKQDMFNAGYRRQTNANQRPLHEDFPDLFQPKYKKTGPRPFAGTKQVLNTVSELAGGGGALGYMAMKTPLGAKAGVVGYGARAASKTLTGVDDLGKLLLDNQKAINTTITDIVAPAAVRTGKVTRLLLESGVPPLVGGHAYGESDPDAAYSAISTALPKLATDPEALNNYYRRTYGPIMGDQNQLYSSFVMKGTTAMQYLHAQLPIDPRPPSIIPTAYEPPRSEKIEFLHKVQAVNDPMAALANPTIEGVKAVEAVYPQTLDYVRTQLKTELVNRKTPLTSGQAKKASMVLGGPVDGSVAPDYLGKLQLAASGTPPPGDQAQGKSKPGPKPKNVTIGKSAANMLAPGSQQNDLENAQ